MAIKALLIFSFFFSIPQVLAGPKKPAKAAVQNEVLLKEVEAQYRQSTSVTMDVKKVLKIKLLYKEKRSQGQILIKAGGKLRWDITTEPKSLVLIDGENIWLVDYPADEDEKPTVLKASNPKRSQPHAVVAFLMGEGKISDEFLVTGQKNVADSLVQLSLKPKKAGESIKWLKMLVDPKGHVIRGLSFEDNVNNETNLTFDNVKFNREIEDSNFVFVTPKGANVTIVD